jgi:pimeloyl-ACP methyl ester carboxylesterase
MLRRMQPISRRIPLGTGLTYHVLEWPGDESHAVFLLHGFLDNAWAWLPVIEAGLGGGGDRGFRMIAPDFRGYGDSDRIGAGGYYHYADYFADLDALIEAVGARGRVSLCGHSMGANASVYFAGTFPDRVHRLALVEPVAPPPENEIGPERVAAWIDASRRARARAPSSYATLDEAAAKLRAHDPRTSPELARRLAELGTTRGDDGRFRFKHDPLHVTTGPYGLRRDVARKFWSRVRCPTLLLEGAQSEYASPDGATRPDVPGARREIIPEAGHMILRHQPAAVARVLTDFLRS